MKTKDIKLAKELKMLRDDLGMPYQPASEACNSLNVDIPDNMAYEMQETLQRVKRAVGGNINDFVTDRLGYKSNIELCKALAAEQIDGVALAIYNIEAKGQALIIGDQTGIGKGRQAAAMIRYGVHRGLKPIFITEKPNLFSDLYRDLAAIGSAHLVPFIVNGREAKTHIKDEDGTIVYMADEPSFQDSVFKSLKVPADRNFVMLTYSQISTNETNDKGEIVALSKKAAFVDSVAEGNIMVVDEAHNASGASNTGKVLQDIVRKTIGVTFLSATFAKRPDNMPIYALKTAISEANMTSDELVAAITSGGVALQEILSSLLVKEGQMMRRERTFEGIEVNYLTLDQLEKQHREISDRVTEIIRDIIGFQLNVVDKEVEALDKIAKAEYKEIEKRKGTQGAGVDNQPYFSKVFNVINQMLFSIKAEEVANLAIKRLQEGKKPVIAFANTMGSFLEDLGVSPGETINADFAVVLQKGLDGVLRYTERDANGKPEYKMFQLSELSEDARLKYLEIQNKINKIATGISISPIDLIIQKIQKAGYTVAEVTGRKYELQLNLVTEAEAKPEKKSSSRKGITLSDLSTKLKKLMPQLQQSAIIGNEELSEVINRLNNEINSIPKLYTTEKEYNGYKKSISENEEPMSFNQFAKAKAHFFIGGSDWYILEWDGQDTLWGYVILNGDLQNAEYGYTSLSELHSIRANKFIGVELDFYFTPTTIAELINKKSGFNGLGNCNCPMRSNKYKKFLGLVNTETKRRFQGVITARTKIATNDAFRQFNNNEIDVLMINQSGSTGASAHAIITNKAPKEQVKQRVMIVLQAELDINTEVQKRGRINRTGQILLPQYDYVSSAIPAEKRLMMMLQKKLKSLDANTTANQKNSDKILSVPDFLNKIGDKVVKEYLIENAELNKLIDDPLGLGESDADSKNSNELIPDAAHKVSGRIAVLSCDMQEQFYNEITQRYNKRVEYLKQTGEYDLEVEAMDLKAEIVSTAILRSGKGGRSAFGEDSILEKVMVNVLKKPFTKAELKTKISEALNNSEPAVLQSELIQNFETFVANKLNEDLAENKNKYDKLIEEIPKEKKIIAIADPSARQYEIKKRTEELEKARQNQIQVLETKSQNNAQYMRHFFSFFYVGRGVNYPSITFGEGESIFTKAIYLGTDIDTNRKNPYAPSAVYLKFALADSNKYIELAASGDTGQKLNEIIGASTQLTTKESKNFVNEWDEVCKASNTNRRIRYIVTGNILQAFSDAKGKLISYTTIDGKVQKGILYPENYNPTLSPNANQIKVPIIAAAKLVKGVIPGTIISTTNKISITSNHAGDYVIMVDGTKKQGGFLFLDTDVLQLVRKNNFEKVSNTMRAFVDKKNMNELITLLQNKFSTSITIDQDLYNTIRKDIEAFKNKQGHDDVILKVNKPAIEANDEMDELELEAQALTLELELMNF